MLLVPNNFTEKERYEFKTELTFFLEGLRVPTLLDYQSRRLEPGKKLIGHGGVIIFDPMEKYNLDQETKETWRDIVTGL